MTATKSSSTTYAVVAILCIVIIYFFLWQPSSSSLKTVEKDVAVISPSTVMKRFSPLSSNSASSRSSTSSINNKNKYYHESRNKILCLGDSNTRLTERREYTDADEKQFPEYLGEILLKRKNKSGSNKSLKNIKIINRGIPNIACSSTKSAKHSVWNRESFMAAMSPMKSAYTADESTQRGNFEWNEIRAVTIAFGTNDSRDKIWANKKEYRDCLMKMISNIEKNIQDSLRRLKTRRSDEAQEQKTIENFAPITVLLLTPPPIDDSGEVAQNYLKKYKVNKERLEKTIAPTVREVANMFRKKQEHPLIDVVLVDVFAELKPTMVQGKKPKWIDEDGIHLNSVGSKMVAEFIFDSM